MLLLRQVSSAARAPPADDQDASEDDGQSAFGGHIPSDVLSSHQDTGEEGGWNRSGEEEELEEGKDSNKGSKAIGDILDCGTCGARSDNAPWYDDQEKVVDGVVVRCPVGDACEICGEASEGWPQLDRPQIVLLFSKSLSFRAEFAKAKERARVVKAPEIPHAHVYSQSACGIRTETDGALVAADDWSAKYGVQADKVPGVTVVSVVDESGILDPEKKLLGILYQIGTVPEGLAWRKVVLYTDISNCITETALAPEDLLRTQHAALKWQERNKDIMASRHTSMRSGLTRLPNGTMVVDLVDKYKVELKRREDLLNAGVSSIDDAAPAAANASGTRRGMARAAGSILQAAASTMVAKSAAKKAKGFASGVQSVADGGLLAAAVRLQKVGKRGSSALLASPGAKRAGSSESGVRVAVGSPGCDASDLDVSMLLTGEEKLGTRLNGAFSCIANPFPPHTCLFRGLGFWPSLLFSTMSPALYVFLNKRRGL